MCSDLFGQSIWKLLPMMFVCRWITYFSWLSFEWKRSKEKIFGMRWTVPAILFWDGEISFLSFFLGLKTWRRIMQPYKFLCIQMYSRRKCRCSKACLPGKERKITATPNALISVLPFISAPCPSCQPVSFMLQILSGDFFRERLLQRQTMAFS